jgi:hypothetical protein
MNVLHSSYSLSSPVWETSESLQLGVLLNFELWHTINIPYHMV